MLHRTLSTIVLSLGAMAPSYAVTIAENSNGNEVATAGVYYLGQSFTAVGSGLFNEASISFFTGFGTPQAYAPGTLHLYSSAFGGQISQLGTGANYLGSAVGASGTYNFGPSLFLSAGTKYFAYISTQSPGARYGGNNVYAGGETFQADASSGLFFAALPSIDLRFGAFANQVAVVPEPQSLAMMIAGLGLIGTAMRRIGRVS